MKKRVLVTGGNSGIGYYMALSLLENNFYVAVLDIEINEISTWKGKYPDELIVFQCDITCQEKVDESIAVSVEAWDQIDIVVNNACKARFRPF